MKQTPIGIAPERMPAIPPEKMTPEQKQAATAIAAGPRGAVKGPFVALLRSPDFMDRVQRVGEYIRFRCPFDKRINEMAAAITARHWTQQFEWWAHARQAIEAGLKPAIAEAIAEGRRPTGMAEDEELVYDFLTELLNNKSVCDATYERALKKFGEQGVIDLIGISGYYALLAMVMNVARTAVPEGNPLPLTGFPAQTKPV
jgi:4-carboxymuconolactone decarboxylase